MYTDHRTRIREVVQLATGDEICTYIGFTLFIQRAEA